jgi:hypothetical protein
MLSGLVEEGGEGEGQSQPVLGGRRSSESWLVVDGKLKPRRGRSLSRSSMNQKAAEEAAENNEADDDMSDDEIEGDSHSEQEQEVHIHHPQLSAFEKSLARKNRELKAMGEPTLRMDEVISGRMYTGPVFHKYNLVLRASGNGPAWMKEKYERTCLGNTYTTTLHVVSNSGYI